MKTLVMTAIFAVTGLTNVVATNVEKNFVYHEVKSGNQVESKMVYKLNDGKYLNHHLKYNFKYDAENRLIRKEVLKWNDIEQAFERCFCLNYNYSEAGTDVEYALWNNETNDYSDVKEKAVYLYSGDGVSYLSYKWNDKDCDWKLMAEHAAGGEEMQLFAGK